MIGKGFKKGLAVILTLFLLSGCGSNQQSSNKPIELVNFVEKEDVKAEVGSYFHYSSYLSVIDTLDHTYVGQVGSIIDPSNELITPYNDSFRLSDIGLYRLNITYPLTSEDTRAKTVYIDSRDTKGPEVFFKKAQKGNLGVPYYLPEAVVSDESNLPVNLSYELFLLGNEGEGKTKVEFHSGCFIPTEVGFYQYVVKATDCFENTSSAALDIEVDTERPLLHERMDKDNYQSVVRVSHTGGAAVSGATFDEEEGSFNFVAKSEDNLYINLQKSINLADYDTLRLKTKTSSKVTNTFIQAELKGPGTGNVFAYYDRVEKNGFTYFEMSVEKFLPYWEVISFNLATMIIIASEDTPFSFYGVELSKNGVISYVSAAEANVNEPYMIEASCVGAVGSTLVHTVFDPLGNIVSVVDNCFTPISIGRYLIHSSISHFLYEGSSSFTLDVTSSKSIVIEDFVNPKLGEEFTIPKANLDGDETGFEISLTRNGLSYPYKDNVINVNNNGKYEIIYRKVDQGITYQKKVTFDVGVLSLESFSTSSSVSKAYGFPNEKVTSFYKEEFDLEKGVVGFSYAQTRWPNIQFSCPNLSHYDFFKYSSISFNLYLPDTLLNLNARYGKNNESQDLTYYSENQGIKANQWSCYNFSIDRFFDKARSETNLPLYLIGVERSEDLESIANTIYVSDIFLTEKEPNVIQGFDSLSGVTYGEVDKMKFHENYQGEHSVVEFQTVWSYPKLYFTFGDISRYNVNAYSYVSFRMWIDPAFDGLFFRKGKNNETDVPSYHKKVRWFNNDNFTTGRWANFNFPATDFINGDRGENPLMLILLRDEDSSLASIYISEIKLIDALPEGTLCDFSSTLYCGGNEETPSRSLDSFEGENGVARFDASGQFPNITFTYENIEKAIEKGFKKLVFRVYLTSDFKGVVLRYGPNNSVDDVTYSRWTVGQITLNQWIDLEYPVDRFDNTDRQGLPLLLIFQKEAGGQSSAYFSKIFLKK